MSLDEALRDTLTDDRWALPVAPDALERVRAGRVARRRRRAVLVTVACAAALGGAALAVPGGSGPRTALSTAANPTASAFTPASGRDWLLTNAQYDAFEATHPRPPVKSPGPGEGRVPSPAPLTSRSADLEAYVQGAGLPAGARLVREDSPGGDPDQTDVHVTLPDGTPVEVSRRQVDRPFAYHQNGGDGQNAGATVEDVPGTSSAAALYPDYGYGFGPGRCCDATGKPLPSQGALVITRDGLMTSWAVPGTVPLATLRGWALTAEEHAR